MHAAAWDYVRRVVQSLPPLKRVAEFGSRSINGTVREIFTDAATYVGIDPVSGANVDVVMDAAEWIGHGFDAVVCCEVFEHTPRIMDLCKSAFRALRPGGFFIITCATDPRKPHSAEGTGAPKKDEFYFNVSRVQLKHALIEAGFAAPLCEILPTPGDLYALALKAR